MSSSSDMPTIPTRKPTCKPTDPQQKPMGSMESKMKPPIAMAILAVAKDLIVSAVSSSLTSVAYPSPWEKQRDSFICTMLSSASCTRLFTIISKTRSTTKQPNMIGGKSMEIADTPESFPTPANTTATKQSPKTMLTTSTMKSPSSASHIVSTTPLMFNQWSHMELPWQIWDSRAEPA